MGVPRILHIIEAYPPDYTGQGRQVESLLPFLSQAGVSCRVVCSWNSANPIASPGGAEVVRLTCRGGARRRLDFAWRLAGWLVRNRRTFDIATFHGIGLFVFMGVLLCRLLGKRTIIVMTLMGVDDPLTIRSTRFGRWKIRFLHLADRYVALCTAMVQGAQSVGLDPRKVRRIPEGVDTDRFAPADGMPREESKCRVCAESGWPADAAVVVFIGAIVPRKGVDVLARAWPAVVAREKRARLLLVGPETGHTREFSAEYVAEVKAMFRKAGVDGTVRFTGFSAEPERYLQAADVFVLPSRNEGFGIVVVEALAVAVPPVVTEMPGVTTDLIDPGQNGEIVPQEDPEALAEAIRGVLGDTARARRMGEAARRTALERFSMSVVARQTVALYRELIS